MMKRILLVIVMAATMVMVHARVESGPLAAKWSMDLKPKRPVWARM